MNLVSVNTVAVRVYIGLVRLIVSRVLFIACLVIKAQCCLDYLMAFCLLTEILPCDVAVTNVLSYMEYLTRNKVSPSMILNHLSAIYCLNYQVFSHSTVQYFVRSVRIHRPIAVAKRNIIDQVTLLRMVSLCNDFSMGPVFKAVFWWRSLVCSDYQISPLTQCILLIILDILLGGLHI